MLLNYPRMRKPTKSQFIEWLVSAIVGALSMLGYINM